MIPLMKYTILIFAFSIMNIYSINVSNASDIIETLRKENPANEKLLKLAINNTLEFLKHYIYYTVSSDPPQPNSIGRSYFPKINYSQIFNNINTSNTNYFDFKNEFISAIRSLNDIHTVAYFNKIPLENYVYICPIELQAEYDKTEKRAKMYGKLSIPENYYYFFKNGDEVAKTIKKNLKTEIKYIKGKDPFTFIEEFARITLRNRHSSYVHNQQIYLRNTFQIPATLDDLTNFTVEYVNNDTFTTEYIVQNVQNNTQQNNDLKYYENDEDNNDFLQYLSDYYKNMNSFDEKGILASSKSFKSLNELILDYEQLNKNKIKSRNLFFETINPNHKQNEEIIWAYNYTSLENKNNIVFQCRVDPKNKVNVVKINSFGGVTDSEPSLSIAEKCAYLFDENEYKIIIIVPKNWGGNPIIGYNIIELLSPYILTRNTIRIKKDENIDKLIEIYTKKLNIFNELNSSKELTKDYFKDGFVAETYGKQTEHFSKPFTWRINQKKIEEIKSKLKHKRIPTDIIILTDGLALSAASSFLKNIHKSGAGIIIGYNGNPNLSKDIFDISQSPSLVLNVNGYLNIYPDLAKNTGKYGIGLYSLTCMATYHEFQDAHTPQEYDVQEPDRIIHIYKPYSDLYYQEFIDETKKVLDSYKDNCNPKNKMLVLFSDECKFLKERLHGGFACGENKKWDKNEDNCIPVYCDTGYYFNKFSKSCIKYPIEGEEKIIIPEKKFELWMIITIAGGAFIILATAITIIILYVKKALCFKKYGEIETPDENDDLLIY